MYMLNKTMFSDSVLCCLAGHAEDVVLSLLERWLQEEAHQKGQQVQVSQVHFCICRLYGNTPQDLKFHERMCTAFFPCDIC